MRKTSLLIPLILVACLAILVYLIVVGFSSSEADDLTRGQRSERIVQGRPDYTDEELPADIGRNTDLETAPRLAPRGAEERDIDDYFEEVPEDEIVRPQASARQESERTPPASSTSTRAPATAPTARQSTAASSGRDYLVLAGSFRQYANATERVERLRAAGFADSRVERFDRGSFAVALAGEADSYGAANQMASRLRSAGFEAQVMRRR